MEKRDSCMHDHFSCPYFTRQSTGYITAERSYPHADMTSCTFLVLLVIPTLVLGITTEVPDFTAHDVDRFFQCRIKASRERSSMQTCIEIELSEEEMNATKALLHDTQDLRSKHFCRKENEILNCVRKTAEILHLSSNKSEIMVPFVRALVEESIHMLCDNDAKLLTVFLKEDQSECAYNILNDCRPSLEGVDDFTESTICDLPVPEGVDPYNKQYFCQRYLGFLECAEGKMEKCSGEMKNGVTRIIHKLRNETSCSKHF